MRAYGARLEMLMELAGFKKQTELARATGLTPTTINRAIKARKRLGNQAHDAIVSALKERIDFDEGWLVYGSGTPPNKEASDRVRAYLASDLAVGISPQVAELLRKVPWHTVGVPVPTTKSIARMRDMIETNLLLG